MIYNNSYRCQTTDNSIIPAQRNQGRMDVVVVEAAVVVVIFSQEPSSGDRSDIDCGNSVTECNIFITSFITNNVTLFYFHCNSFIQLLSRQNTKMDSSSRNRNVEIVMSNLFDWKPLNYEVFKSMGNNNIQNFWFSIINVMHIWATYQ